MAFATEYASIKAIKASVIAIGMSEVKSADEIEGVEKEGRLASS